MWWVGYSGKCSWGRIRIESSKFEDWLSRRSNGRVEPINASDVGKVEGSLDCWVRQGQCVGGVLVSFLVPGSDVVQCSLDIWMLECW